MNERTTVRLPAQLLDRARRKAAAEGRTLTSLIESGLEKELAESKPKRRRVSLPVSKATGGPMPGYEENPHRAAQEAEDTEYVERMDRSFR
ncbi:MAG: hypothetical protein ACO1NY_08010 [Pseudorhodoplanes sp.]